MIITYKNLDFEDKEVDLGNAVSVKINGVQISETKLGLRISVEKGMCVEPQAANSIEVYDNN